MWYESLERNNFLVSLYEKVPELKEVRISEINIHDEGRIVAVKFDMPYYAERPPKSGWNKVIILLLLELIFRLYTKLNSVPVH